MGGIDSNRLNSIPAPPGKSGGARVIYFNRLACGEIWLLTIYAKGDRSTIPARELKLIKEAIDDD